MVVFDTDGISNDAIDMFAPLSVTVGPPVWVQAYDVAYSDDVPSRVIWVSTIAVRSAPALATGAAPDWT